MKINVRHEPATAADNPPGSLATPEQSCVWIVGEEETEATVYLSGEEGVSIEVGAEIQGNESIQDLPPGTVAKPTAQMGEVEIPAPPAVDPDVDQKAGERPGEAEAKRRRERRENAEEPAGSLGGAEVEPGAASVDESEPEKTSTTVASDGESGRNATDIP